MGSAAAVPLACRVRLGGLRGLTPGVLGLCAMLLAGAQQARAQDVPQEGTEAQDRARRHFRMGVDFYRERNYSAALIEFQRAYDLVSHYKILFNMGQALVELQDYGRAVERLQEYLDRGGDELEPDHRDEVEAMIEQQRARLVELRLTVEQSGVDVFIDGRHMGTTPLSSSLQVGAGRRRLRLVKSDFVTLERVLDLAAGDTHQLELSMRPETEVAQAQSESTYPSAPPPSSNTATWVAGITTLALAGGAGGLALWTLKAEGDLTDQRAQATTKERLATLSDRVKQRALFTDIALGASLVSAVVTGVLLVADDEPPVEYRARIGVGPNGAALTFDGRF